MPATAVTGGPGSPPASALDCSLALAVTADGGQAAVAGSGGRVRLMNGATGDLIRWIDVGAPVSALAMTAQAVAAATPGASWSMTSTAGPGAGRGARAAR